MHVILMSATGYSLVTANSWVGMAICYAAVMGIYYSNTWNVST